MGGKREGGGEQEMDGWGEWMMGEIMEHETRQCKTETGDSTPRGQRGEVKRGERGGGGAHLHTDATMREQNGGRK